MEPDSHILLQHNVIRVCCCRRQLTCSDFSISIFATADASTSNDGELAFGQTVHVSQGCSGQIQQRLPTEAPNLHPPSSIL